MIPTTTISMTVNGAPVGPHEVPDTLPMIDYLNDHLGLTGTKFGCGLGICHACVVIVERGDGTRDTERTCINGAASFDGLKITTVEGHADGATLSVRLLPPRLRQRSHAHDRDAEAGSDPEKRNRSDHRNSTWRTYLPMLGICSLL